MQRIEEGQVWLRRRGGRRVTISSTANNNGRQIARATDQFGEKRVMLDDVLIRDYILERAS